METETITYGFSCVAAEAVLALTAVVAIALAAVTPAGLRKWLSAFTFIGMLAALLAEIFVTRQPNSSMLFGAYLSSAPAFSAFAIGCAILSGLLAVAYFTKGAKNRNEFLALLSICTMALILFVRANNLMLAFVALECATLCLYIMAAWSNTKAASLEAGAKYLVVSGVSGALFLLGIAFVYGAGLATHIDLMDFRNFGSGLIDPLFCIGMVLIFAGLFFKMSAFPFQFWSPDVYQGSPTPVSAFFSVASKAAGIVFMARICTAFDSQMMAFGSMSDKLVLVLSVVAACTIIVGNFGAITQINVKRLMGFSGIANAGYLLVLLAAMVKTRLSPDIFNFTLYFYLTAYMLASYALFFVISQFEGYDDYDQCISDYRGLSRKNSTMTGALAINLASLAGIPPTAGFFGKVLILIFAWIAQLYWLMGIMILGSVISIYYYFAWMRSAFDKPEGAERQVRPSMALASTMISLSILTLVFGVLVSIFVPDLPL